MRESSSLFRNSNHSEFGTSHVPVGAGAGFNFTFSTSEGAILLLPEGGLQENLRDRGTFMDQALKHGLAWYEYANVTRRRLAENGSLYLVTGCDKTALWGIASFSNSSGGDGVSLKFTIAQIASGNASCSYKWETSSPATVRYGPITSDQGTLEPQINNADRHRGRNRRRRGRTGQPVEDSQVTAQDRPSISQQRLQNQCVLVRGYRISIRPATLAKLKGPLKLSPIQDTDPNNVFKNKSHDIPFSNSGKRSWFANIFGDRRQGSGSQRTCDSQKSLHAKNKSDDLSSVGDVILESVPSVTKVICFLKCQELLIYIH